MRQNEHDMWYISWSDKYTFGFQDASMPIFRKPTLAETITEWEKTGGFDITKYFNEKVYEKYNYSEEALNNILKKTYKNDKVLKKLGELLYELGGKGDYVSGSTTNHAEYPGIIYMMLMDFMRYKFEKYGYKTDDEIKQQLFDNTLKDDNGKTQQQVWEEWLNLPHTGGKRGKPRRKTRRKTRQKPRRKPRRKTRRKPRKIK